MSFFGHLEELRSRLFKAALFVLAGCAIAAWQGDWIMNQALLKPAIDSHVKLQNIEPFGQAFLYFKVILVSGLIISFPFVLHQIWKFIAPGLYLTERRWARTITVITSLSFLIGVAFAYFLLIPSMLDYVNNFANPNIENNISATNYLSFFINMLLASGLMFELPMITWVLARIGIVSAAFLNKYRRHAIILILVLAAVITPTPDPVGQMMVAVPLYFLFEISVFIARIVNPGSKDPEIAEA